MNLITVFDLKTALRLEQCGFSNYAIKKINKNKKVYCFQKTDEILKILNQLFEKDVWVEDNILTF